MLLFDLRLTDNMECWIGVEKNEDLIEFRIELNLWRLWITLLKINWSTGRW